MSELSKSMESLERCLNQSENTEGQCRRKNQKGKVTVDVKSTLRSIVKQKEDQDGGHVFNGHVFNVDVFNGHVFNVDENVNAPANKIKVDFIAKELAMAERSKGNKLPIANAVDAMKMHCRPLRKQTKNPVTPRKKKRMCFRSRRERLLERKRKEAEAQEMEKFEPVMNIQYMSEDEDVSDGEGWRHLKLTWRADEVTRFFRALDERTANKKKEHMAERTKRTKTMISSLLAPKNAPRWALKSTVVPEVSGTPLSRNAGRCRGTRTRGGCSSSESRRSTSEMERIPRPAKPHKDVVVSISVHKISSIKFGASFRKLICTV